MSVAQFKTLVFYELKADWMDRERFLSPLFFSLTILMILILAFENSHLEPRYAFVAQLFLTSFLGLQISLLRAFEKEQQGGVFKLLCTYPIQPMHWFFAKFLSMMVSAIFLLLTLLPLTLFFNAIESSIYSLLAIGGIFMLVLVGLCSLGILLSALVLAASGKEVLFPILFFPLASPLLLSGIEMTFSLASSGAGGGDIKHWFGLLLASDVIYLVLGVLLFCEVVDAG